LFDRGGAEQFRHRRVEIKPFVGLQRNNGDAGGIGFKYLAQALFALADVMTLT
jgi:hypothetical protein